MFFGLDDGMGEGWESGGWALGSKQVFFDLLQLRASWVRLRKRGKKEKREGARAVTLSH